MHSNAWPTENMVCSAVMLGEAILLIVPFPEHGNFIA
jgi:hypothetical protein